MSEFSPFQLNLYSFVTVEFTGTIIARKPFYKCKVHKKRWNTLLGLFLCHRCHCGNTVSAKERLCIFIMYVDTADFADTLAFRLTFLSTSVYTWHLLFSSWISAVTKEDQNWKSEIFNQEDQSKKAMWTWPFTLYVPLLMTTPNVNKMYKVLYPK